MFFLILYINHLNCMATPIHQIIFVFITEHATDLIRDRAVELINGRQEGDKPMFMWLSFTAAREPYQSPSEFSNIYGGLESQRRQAYLGKLEKIFSSPA